MLPCTAPVSKLPHVGTTIFTTMSALAAEKSAINLGQGFPDFACDAALPELVYQAMQAGHNQYPPMAGLPSLRQAVVQKIAQEYGRQYRPEDEITITAGATQALLTAILALVHPGDEVVLLDPSYDSYAPAVLLAGAVPRRLELAAPDFSPDFSALAALLNSKTRLLVINTPHNPSASIWSAQHMQALAQLLDAFPNVFLLSDEVYEHMVFDGQRHESAARYPSLAERAFIVSSFGKTYHVTGWKVGYVAAPAYLMQEFRKVHQFNVFTANTPMQHALAAYMQDPTPYRALAAFYQQKRDYFRAGLQASGFRLLPCAGSYFQCVDYSGVRSAQRHLNEADFCTWLTSEIGVAAIPLSVFYASGLEQSCIRFCFAKSTATLDAALGRLAKI